MMNNKKLIYIILSSALIVVLIIVGIILISKLKEDKSTFDDEQEDYTGEIDYNFELSKDNIVLCLDKGNFTVTYDVTKDVEYTINIISSNNDICIVENGQLKPISIGECLITYTCVFDTKTINDYLNVKVIDYIENIAVNVESVAINEFYVTVTLDKIPQINNLSINCDEFIIISDMSSQDNIFKFKATSNSYISELLIKYKNIASNFNNEINKNVELIEDVAYIKYTTSLQANNKTYNLYNLNLDYKQYANNDGFYNSLDIIISEGVHDDYAEYKLISSSNVVIIEGLTIIAKNVGESIVSIYCNDRIVDSINIIVNNVDISSVTFVDDINLYVGDNFDIRPTNIIPNYSLYKIEYHIINGQDNITLVDGIVAALSCGECKILIVVGGLSKEVNININNILQYEFYLLDHNFNRIENDIYYLTDDTNYISYELITNGLLNDYIVTKTNSENINITVFSDYIIVGVATPGEYIVDFYLSNNNDLIKTIKFIKS